MAGIYLHIPFCKQACYYCDFHFSTNRSSVNDMIDAIAGEISLQKNYLTGESIDTIYFGGGTPSILPTTGVYNLLDAINRHFSIAPRPEITLEANPDDLTPQRLKEFADAGINRLSIGIQSFDEEVLRFLNRAHGAADALACFGEARNAGFDNISIDLIYAIPGQGHAQWMANVERAMQLRPEHLSAYSLTVEPKTVFGNWASKGKIVPVGDDISAEQYEVLSAALSSNGFEHYEVSNYALPGFHSRHNTSYWKQQKYLGVGPSAHSFNLKSRQYNVSNNHEYVRSIRSGKIPFTLEVLAREDKINDFLLTTLRTSWGADLLWLQENMNFDLIAYHQRYVDELIQNGLAMVQNSHLILTNRGRLLADKISSDLFVTSEG